MTLKEDYLNRCNAKSDINEHLPTLYGLVVESARQRGDGQCDVVEFGVRTGNSTAAWLAAGATLTSYDINKPSYVPPVDVTGQWTFYQQDTGADDFTIPWCDIFFIDTLHTGDHIRKELRHADRCFRYFVIHDTVLFGTHGELGRSGITGAIYDFLAQGKFTVLKHYENNCGLLVLKRV